MTYKRCENCGQLTEAIWRVRKNRVLIYSCGRCVKEHFASKQNALNRAVGELRTRSVYSGDEQRSTS